MTKRIAPQTRERSSSGITAACTEPRPTSRIITPTPEPNSAVVSSAIETAGGPEASGTRISGSGARMKERISALPSPIRAFNRLAQAEPMMLPSAPTPRAMPIAPEPRPSSRVAKRTTSAQKAVLKRLKVAVPISAACSSGVRRTKRMPAAMPPDSGDATGGSGTSARRTKSAEKMKVTASTAIATGALNAATRRPPSVLPPTIETERLPISSELASTYSPGLTSEVKTVCSATMKRTPRVPVAKATM